MKHRRWFVLNRSDSTSMSRYCSILRALKQGSTQKPKWGFSSAGRAPALQAGGQGFDSLNLHHMGQ